MSRIIHVWLSTMTQSRSLGSSSLCRQSTVKTYSLAGRSCARFDLISIAVRLSGRLGTYSALKSELIGIPQAGIARRLLRETGDPQVFCRAQVVVRGRMKRSRARSFSPAVVLRKDSSSDRGRVCMSTGDAQNPRAAFQNGLWIKSSSHHVRQRSTVRRLTPTTSRT